MRVLLLDGAVKKTRKRRILFDVELIKNAPLFLFESRDILIQFIARDEQVGELEMELGLLHERDGLMIVGFWDEELYRRRMEQALECAFPCFLGFLDFHELTHEGKLLIRDVQRIRQSVADTGQAIIDIGIRCLHTADGILETSQFGIGCLLLHVLLDELVKDCLILILERRWQCCW